MDSAVLGTMGGGGGNGGFRDASFAHQTQAVVHYTPNPDALGFLGGRVTS